MWVRCVYLFIYLSIFAFMHMRTHTHTYLHVYHSWPSTPESTGSRAWRAPEWPDTHGPPLILMSVLPYSSAIAQPGHQPSWVLVWETGLLTALSSLLFASWTFIVKN